MFSFEQLHTDCATALFIAFKSCITKNQITTNQDVKQIKIIRLNFYLVFGTVLAIASHNVIQGNGYLI